MNQFLKTLLFLAPLFFTAKNSNAQNNQFSFQNYFEFSLDEQKEYFNTIKSPTIGYSTLDSYKRKTKTWKVELGFSKAMPLMDTIPVNTNNNIEKRVYDPFKSINLSFSRGADYELTSRIFLTYSFPISFRYVYYDYQIIENNYVSDNGVIEFRVALMPKGGIKIKLFKELYLGLETFYLLSVNSGGGYDENKINSYAGLFPSLSIKF